MLLTALGIGTLLLIKKKRKKKFMNPTQSEIKEAFNWVAKTYGTENAQMLEKLIRWETAHFKSNGFKLTNAAGMEATTKKFPYGWTSLKNYWQIQKDAAPVGLKNMTDIGGRNVNFLVFPTFFAFVRTICKHLQNKNWNFGAWYSLDEQKQITYLQKINSINPKYT
jgi:hypothetical protein